MLKLVITGPSNSKVELECEPDTTFGEVKKRVEVALGVPPDKQRLLCNGRERKDAKETLAAAGVTAKSKLMLMLAQGYVMPAKPETKEGVPGKEPEAEQAPVDVEAELPLPDGVEVGPDAVPGLVVVRQGRNRYRIRVPMGLARATFGEVAQLLSQKLLPPGIPPSELRFLRQGKTATLDSPLAAEGVAEMSVFLLFKEGFHAAAEGATWLSDYSAELVQAEKQIESITRRVDANFADAETSVKLSEVSELVETLKQSVDSVRVRETQLQELRDLKARAVSAADRIEGLKKRLRL